MGLLLDEKGRVRLERGGVCGVGGVAGREGGGGAFWAFKTRLAFLSILILIQVLHF